MQACTLQSFAAIFEKLDETKKFTVLKFAEFLLYGMGEAYSEDEEKYWISEYDKAKAEDDGYRISLEEWRKNHGI